MCGGAEDDRSRESHVRQDGSSWCRVQKGLTMDNEGYCFFFFSDLLVFIFSVALTGCHLPLDIFKSRGYFLSVLI